MKNVLLTFLVVFALLFSCSMVAGQGKGAAGKTGKTKAVPKMGRRQSRFDSNEALRKAKQMRLERLRQMREQRRDRGTEGTRRKLNAEEKRLGKGKTGQELKQFEAKLAAEQAKHLRRITRLSRIRELADQQGSTKIIGRVDKLMRAEQLRYTNKRQKVRTQMQKLLRVRAGERSPMPPQGEKSGRKYYRKRPPRRDKSRVKPPTKKIPDSNSTL